MRIVIELKKDATPEVVLNQLFKLTQLQTSFGITNLAIVEGKPMILGLHEMLGRFIDHRRDVVIRRTEFDLRKARERMHILEGFKIALINLDDVIALIRKAQTPSEARDGLCVKYSLSLTQSQAILDLRLQKLTGLERLSIEKEHAELAKAIEYLLGILADSSIIDSIIVAELEAVLEKYTDDRRTEILDDGIDIMVEDLIEDEDMVVTISHAGYVKRVSAATYKAQRRGGKGVMGAVTKEDDFTEQLFVASALSEIMFFTNLGRVYSLKVYEIPEASRTARGRALVNLLSLKESEKLTAVLSVREFKDDHFIVMATEQGIIKKSELSQYAKIRKTGVQACTLDEGDKLIGVSMTTSGDTDIVLSTKDGNSIRFNETKVRSMGRTARGVCGINLSEGDKVVGMTVVSNTTIEGEEEPTLLTITENGFGKRSAISEYRQQSRAGKGVIDIKTSERNGGVVSIQTVVDASEIMLITSSGKIIRIKANTLSVIGRNTQGVRLVGLDEGEKVVATSPLAESADDGVDA